MSSSVSTRDKILDISVNLTRIGNWVADSYLDKKDLIKFFLDQTDEYISEVRASKVSEEFKPVFVKFDREFQKLKNSQEFDDAWAENALTWANILAHRAKLA